jgi:EmrB/QacA subfamily drug resistance transporter
VRVGAAARSALIVGLGTLVVPLDSAVNVAFPHITAAFGLALPQIQYVVIFYTVAYASLMLVFGRIGDIFGHRLVFILGAGLSTLAFAGCGAAVSFGWLLAARVLQGIGAALLLSCGPALITAAAPEAMRARMLGLYTMMFAIGGALGPLLAGPLIAHWGWRAVYWFRLPIAAATGALAFALPSPPRAAVREPFDAPGAVLLVAFIGAVVLGLDRLRHLPDGAPLLLLAIAATIATACAFVRRELAVARPIIDVRVFRDPGFALVNVANLVVNLSMFSVLLLLPFYLHRMASLSVPAAGLLLAAQPLGAMIAAPLAGRAAARIPPPRMILWGSLLAAAGLASIGFVGRQTDIPLLAASMFANGVGVGLFQVAYFDIVTGTLPRGDRGVAGSLAMVTRTLGVIAGATLLVLAFETIAGGADDTDAFLSGIRGAFRIAAVLPLVPILLGFALGRWRGAPGPRASDGAAARQKKTLLVLRNSPIAGQWSMWHSADHIAAAAAPDFAARMYTPPVTLSRLPLKGARKYLIYVDVYVLGAIGLALAARHAELVVAADHGYAPALWLVARRKRTAFVHDTIALRQAAGLLPGAPPVSATGRLYQAWIRRALARMPVLAVNTALDAGCLGELGIRTATVEVGQPAAAHRLGAGETRPEGTPYLLHVGGDSWLKNKAYLLAVYAALRARMGADAPELVMAGSTSAATMDRIAACGLGGHVRCLSAPSDADLAALYAGARAVISTSIAEGFGIPPLEGLMFGRLPLLADIPVFRHLYGQVARLFPLDDARSAAAILAEALAGDAKPPEPARKALLERYSADQVSCRTRAWLAAALRAAAP